MLIRFLISRSGQAGASSTRNRQRAWPPLKNDLQACRKDTLASGAYVDRTIGKQRQKGVAARRSCSSQWRWSRMCGVIVRVRSGRARRAIRSNRTSAESAANVAVDVGPIDWAGRVFNRDVAWMLMKIVIGVRMARLCLLKATHALACRSRSWPTTCDAKL